jgi:hypothetical protein
MPANTAPIFGLTPNVNSVAPVGVNVKSDGSGTIGTDIFKAFTAGSNGAWVSRVRFTSTASVAATTTTNTSVRVFVSSKTSGATTSADTWLVGELNLPSVSAAHSTNATVPQELPCNFAIPAGYTVLVTYHVAHAANSGIQATVFGTDY